MNQELQNFLKDLVTIYQEKYDDSSVGNDIEDEKSAAFRKGCNFAYYDALDIIASQIKSFGFHNTDLKFNHSSEVDKKQECIDEQCYSIGIDGCKGGWICAVIKGAKLTIQRFPSITDVMNAYSDFHSVLIDMPIGLQSNSGHIRPDSYARQIIRERTSTIFPAPCRQAIYAETVSQAYEENERVLGKYF